MTQTTPTLVVVGAGRHGRVVAETASSTGRFRVLAYADDRPEKHGEKLGSWEVKGTWQSIGADAYIVAIGDNRQRRQVFDQLMAAGKRLATVISERALISPDASVGPGSVILAGAIVQAGARIGENVIINAGAVIDHDAVIQAHAHLGPHATVESYAVVNSGEVLGPASCRRRLESDAVEVPTPAAPAAAPVAPAPAVAGRLPAAANPLVSGEAGLGLDWLPTPKGFGSERIRLSIPHMSGAEMRFVQEAFSTNWMSTVGPNLTALELEFSRKIGLPSLAVGSGTAGIHLGLRLLGVQPGDEVVCPTLTFVASCNPIRYLGATPVFIDSDRASWNIDAGLLADFFQERARTGRLPRAVVVVDLLGQPADMDAILAVCRRYEIPVLEDAAEALGAEYHGQPVGAAGDVNVFSLNGNKVITATSGGILCSARAEWIEKARFWSNQACDPDPLRNYVHSEIGHNYRLSNVLAGIARGQLQVLETRVQQRRQVFDRYCEGFAGIPGLEAMPSAPWGKPSRWLSCFTIDEAQFGVSASGLGRFLSAANVESRPVWRPMHTQPLYRHCECIGGAVAEDLNRRGICLPSSSSLSAEDQQFVIDRIRDAHERAHA